MGVRKALKRMDESIQWAFNNVKSDILTVLSRANEANETAERVGRFASAQIRKTHVHNVKGELVPTLNGRVKAIEELLGITFEVKPAKRIPVQVVASTPKKKASKK